MVGVDGRERRKKDPFYPNRIPGSLTAVVYVAVSGEASAGECEHLLSSPYP